MEQTNPYAAPQGGPLFHERRPIAVPVGIADALRVATSLYIGNFLSIAAITLLFWVPLELFQAYFDFFIADPENPASSFQLTLLIENVIGIIPATGVMAIGAAALRGEEPKIMLGITQGFEAWPRIFVTRLTVSIVILLAMVLFIIPGLYVAVRVALAEPAALLERRGGMGAPGRSFDLTRGNFWRTAAALFVIYAYIVGVVVLVSIPTQFYDHWLLSAALNLLMDLLSPWAILILLTAYWSRAHAGQGNEPLPVAG